MKGHKFFNIVFAAAAAIFIAVAAPYAYASSEIPIMQAATTEDSIILYLRGGISERTAEAQIGTEKVGSVQIRELDESDPIVTWLLVDNSLSIEKADREKTNKLLTDIAAGKLPNERITLCTISDCLKIITRDSQNYAELKTQIDSIQYENQETFLTDVLDELLNEEETRTEHVYVRCIVISDGVDNNPDGITRDELLKRLSEKNIPIYTFGCKGDDDALKAMYSLSRMTGAESWVMEDITDTLSVIKELSSTEIPLRADIAIPEKIRDGTVKGLQLVFPDGSTAQMQLLMPFGTITPEPEPDPEPDPEPEPEPESVPEIVAEDDPPIVLYVVIGCVVVTGSVVLLFFLIRKRKEKTRVRTVSEGPNKSPNRISSGTEFVDIGDESTDTLILVGDDRNYMLSLTDTKHTEKYFEAPLRDKITIGRSPENQIVIDYDNTVSSSHCEVIVSGNMLKIRDLNSRNGTYLDGNRVADTAEIVNGSTIKLGRVVLKVGIR